MTIRLVLASTIVLGACTVDAADPTGEASISGADQNVDNPVRTETDPTSIAASTSWTPCSCGQVLATFDGQAAYCDGGGDTTCAGTGPYGYRYQCVELVNRFLQVVKHKPHVSANAGTDFCDTARLNRAYTSWGPGYSNNHGHKPGPGDILVWNSDYGAGTGYPGHDAGHVAIVTGSDAGHLYYMQQNWGWYSGAWGQLGASSTPWNSTTSWFGAPGADINNTFHKPACWVHPE
jgi:hypothetical protein